MRRKVHRKGHFRDGKWIPPGFQTVVTGKTPTTPAIDLRPISGNEVKYLEFLDLDYWFDDTKTLADCMELVEMLGKETELVGWGNNRVVFRCPGDDGSVVKVAYNEDGMGANSMEWLASRDTDMMAETEWWEDPLGSGLCVKAEWVEPIAEGEEKPEWAGMIDCGQVGYTKDGRLVAFDL